MLNILRKLIPERSKVRLYYHKFSAMLAAIYYRFPANKLKVIAVTGTSGKSTTVELIRYLLHSSGKRCGAISSIQFYIGDTVLDNSTLRTSLRPKHTQRLLSQMVKEGCEYAVIEISSHAIDQNRNWGINVDTAVLTNISDNEHLDYHGSFADYVRTKSKLFQDLNFSPRKPNVSKTIVLNRDDSQYDFFSEIPSDRKATFSIKKQSDYQAQKVKFTTKSTNFHIRIPNAEANITVPVVGSHNLENILAAVAVAMSVGINLEVIADNLKRFTGAPGRLETIDLGQKFSVVVDYTYKPAALKPVLETLKNITKGRIIVVWGGTGNRPNFELFQKNLHECGSILDELADEIVLTTDDPNDDDPKKIAATVREKINRKEGENFFEIEDRYEAIRYAIFIAEPNDTVLVAGRGHEKIQTIGAHKIPFDDRAVCREILSFAKDQDLLSETGNLDEVSSEEIGLTRPIEDTHDDFLK